MSRERQKMFKRMLMLVTIVFLSILSLGVQSVASASEQFDRLDQSNEQEFFTQLNRDITLEQAISEYPAILDYFPIEEVSPSESVDASIPVYDFSNVSAYDLLSSLNARKRSSTDVRDIGLERIVEVKSNGAAWPYTYVSSQYINCYGYAINESIYQNPGFSYYNGSPVNRYTTLNEYVTYIGNDMARFNQGGARTISSQTSSIGNNEWRIALRKGEGYVVQGGKTYFVWDYHFLLQCSGGDWCHKQGATPSGYLGFVNPATRNWPLLNVPNFYNSATRFIAVH